MRSRWRPLQLLRERLGYRRYDFLAKLSETSVELSAVCLEL